MRGGVKHISGIEREKHESIREHGTCTPWRGEDEMLYNIYIFFSFCQVRVPVYCVPGNV